MPTTIDIYDKEETFGLKTFELTLTCGKCQKGQLTATTQKAESGETIHSCTHCGREQSIAGEPYPRIVVKRELVGDRHVIHPEVIPDKDPDLYDQSEVSLLSQDKKVELLLSTRNPVIIDHLQNTTIHALRHTLDDLLNAFWDMSREAARIRAKGVPVGELEELLTMKQVNDMPFDQVVELIASTNRHPGNVDLIRNKNYGVLYDVSFREALYSAAKEVVIYRQQQSEDKPEVLFSDVVQPVKNKGGRPRKQLVVA